MVRRRFLTGLWLFAGVLSLPAQSKDEPKAESKTDEAWRAKVFRLPVGYSWKDETPAPLAAPERTSTLLALPPAGASAAQWEECLRASSRIIGDWCRKGEFEPPSGTLFLHDVANGSLAVRSTQKWLDEFEYFTEVLTQQVPVTIACSVDILQSDADTIRALLRSTEEKHDHAEDLQRLKSMMREGRAKLVQQLRLETRSGQRADVQAGGITSATESLSIDEAGRTETAVTGGYLGTRFEVDPVVGFDGRRVDVHAALEHHFAPPVRRMAFVGQARKHGAIETPVTDYRMVALTSCLSFRQGGTRVLGVWTPEGTPEFAKGDVMQAAFLGVNLMRALPAANPSLLKVLDDHGPRVAPDLPPGERGIPAGMERRWFNVPPDFLSAAGGGGVEPAAPADPFAPAGMAQTSASRTKSAAAVLKAMGIDFPEGASAHFIAATSQIVVTNIPKNLDFVDALVSEWSCCRWPYMIAHTLHIIEGDGEVLRRLAKETQMESDHGAIWKQVEALAAQGRVKLLRTARLETRSGHRVTFESGICRSYVAEVRFKDLVVKRAGTEPVKRRLLQANFDSKMLGTRFEIDPVTGPDGWRLDGHVVLNYAFAPPTAAVPDASFHGNTTRIGFPTSTFPEAQIESAFIVTWGMTKLLGLWRPEGTPEFDGQDVMQAAFVRAHRAPAEAGMVR